MPGNYFDERIAATYEAKWPELFEPAVVDPAVSFLAGLARSRTALELGIGTLAGMTLRERWSSWHREPFTADSRSHISVWQKPS